MRFINSHITKDFTFEVFEFNTCRIIRVYFDGKFVLFRDNKRQFILPEWGDGNAIMDELKNNYLAYIHIGDNIYVNTELLEIEAIKVDFGEYTPSYKVFYIEEIK